MVLGQRVTDSCRATGGGGWPQFVAVNWWLAPLHHMFKDNESYTLPLHIADSGVTDVDAAIAPMTNIDAGWREAHTKVHQVACVFRVLHPDLPTLCLPQRIALDMDCEIIMGRL